MNKKSILAAAVAAVLSTSLVVGGINNVMASDKTVSSEQQAQTQQIEKKQQAADLLKVSHDALLSMRDLHAARLALFNGDPSQARTFVDAASTRIDAAVAAGEQYAVDVKAPKADDQYVPFNADLSVLDTYLPTQEKSDHIDKANQQLSKGEREKALETLKLGEVNVAISTNLIPVKFAQEHINMAAKLITQGKFYEANLALKAVDDATMIQTVALDATPKAATEHAQAQTQPPAAAPANSKS